jgi:hypothetical protein
MERGEGEEVKGGGGEREQERERERLRLQEMGRKMECYCNLVERLRNDL